MNYKGLLYNSSKEFSLLIKHYYKKSIQLDIFSEQNIQENIKIKSYSICFFFVEELSDLLFLKILKSQIPYCLIVTTKLPLFNLMKKANYDEVLFLNTMDTKSIKINEIHSSILKNSDLIF